MKKLIALVAMLGMSPVAHAAEGADFSHSGDFRLIYVNNQNSDGNDDAGSSNEASWTQRLRWGTSVRAGEKMTANFTLVHNATWGNNWATSQYPSDVTADTTTGDTSTENLLLVNEAYVNWMASDAWMIRFGRGAFTMADGRFVSSNDWEQVQKAFEGGLATWDQEMARFSFFAVQGANFSDDNAQGNFFGACADFKTLPSFLKSANLHVVQVKRDNSADLAAAGLSGKESVLKAGVVLTGDVAGLDWRANYEMEDGENETADTDVSTSMIDAEVGYTLGWKNTRIFAGYHTDTGTSASTTDDETYDGFHYDTHTNAGLMDIFGWGNLTYTRVGATMAATDDISVAVEYLMFTQTEKDGAISGTTATATAFRDSDGDITNGVDNFDADEDDLGTELDITVTKKYTNNFNIGASYRMFSPGDEFKTAGLEDAYNQIYVEANLKF